MGRLKKCFAETLHKDIVMQFAPQKRRREENRARQRVDDWLMKTVSKMGSGLIGSKTKTNVPSLFRELMNEEEKGGLLTINTNSAHICRQEQCILVEVTLSYFPSIKKGKVAQLWRRKNKNEPPLIVLKCCKKKK